MAMLIKKQYELVALKVSLKRERRETAILIELESNEGGKPYVHYSSALPKSAFGLPHALEPRSQPSFVVPEQMKSEVAAALEHLDLLPDEGLWLHLVKPYGYLGAVAWEDVFTPIFQRPLLRVPDFLEMARERRSVLDVAICCSAPLSEPTFYPPQLLGILVNRILKDSPRSNTQIHVFADAEYYDELVHAYAGRSNVVVHDPDMAARYGIADTSETIPDSPRSIVCPWLLWIRDAMKGRSLDTVHFVCHGYLSDERSAFSVSESPLRNRDRRNARFVGVAEAATFLNQTGAWSVAFSAPPGNYSEPGLRLFLDTLAQTRPGPALYHDAGRDTEFLFAGDAYRFLFAPQPTTPPKPAPLFMYCQPALVRTEQPQTPTPTRAGLRSVIEANAALFDDVPVSRPSAPKRKGKNRSAQAIAPQPSSPSNVASWVAAAQRFMEEAALVIQRREAQQQSNPSPRVMTNLNTVEQTLREAQEVIGRAARDPSNEPKD